MFVRVLFVFVCLWMVASAQWWGNDDSFGGGWFGQGLLSQGWFGGGDDGWFGGGWGGDSDDGWGLWGSD